MESFTTSDGYTHIGNVRKRNEDAWLGDPERGLWVVCDGMGGHDAGDYASSHIVESLGRCPFPARHGAAVRTIRACLAECNQHLVDYSSDNGLDQVGSTLVALYLRDWTATVLWAGDSRAYRLRDGRLRQISRDHSYGVELADAAGDDFAQVPEGYSQAITRAVGVAPRLRLDTLFSQVHPGDRWLLCSDGVSGSLTTERMAQVMEDSPAPGRDLVEEAMDSGSRDNCTAVIIRVTGPT